MWCRWVSMKMNGNLSPQLGRCNHGNQTKTRREGFFLCLKRQCSKSHVFSMDFGQHILILIYLRSSGMVGGSEAIIYIYIICKDQWNTLGTPIISSLWSQFPAHVIGWHLEVLTCQILMESSSRLWRAVIILKRKVTCVFPKWCSLDRPRGGIVIDENHECQLSSKCFFCCTTTHHEDHPYYTSKPCGLQLSYVGTLFTDSNQKLENSRQVLDAPDICWNSARCWQ